MSITIPSSRSGESARPSPPITNGSPRSTACLTYISRCLFHTPAMAGNRIEAWWEYKVLLDIVATPIHCRTRRPLAERAPENRMPAEYARFPAVMFLREGWLLHWQENPQNSHSAPTLTMVPTVCWTLAVARLWHLLQVLNSSNSLDIDIMNFLSSTGLQGSSLLKHLKVNKLEGLKDCYFTADRICFNNKYNDLQKSSKTSFLLSNI